MKTKDEVRDKVCAMVYPCKNQSQLDNAIHWCNLLLKHLRKENTILFYDAYTTISKAVTVQEYRLNSKLQKAIVSTYGEVVSV